MKKILLCSCIFVGCSIATSYGQSSTIPITIETVTSLKPFDSRVLTFTSEDELQFAISDKLEAFKEMVVQNQNDPSVATYYREEIWRLENAVVASKNNL
jgi:hypothetical protein